MKIRFEFIILAVIAAGLTLYLIFRPRERMNYELPVVERIQEKDVYGIELIRQDKIIKVTRSDGLWRIQPEGYRADSDRVGQMMEEIGRFSIADLTSETKNYRLYELDEKSRKRVIVYGKDDKVILQFDIGKRADLYQHVYVKLEQDERIFQAKGNFHTAFGQDREDMRDKLILSFEAEAVSKIDVSMGAKQISLTKKIVPATAEDQETEISAEQSAGKDDRSTTGNQAAQPQNTTRISWQRPDGTEWDAEQVDRLLDVISDLRCLKFAEDDVPLEAAYLKATIAAAGTEHVLTVYHKQGDDFPSTSTGNEFPFILSHYWVEKIVDFIEGKTE